MYATFCWPGNTGVSMRRSPLENIVYDFVLTSSAVPSISCLPDLDGLWYGRQVVIQFLFQRSFVFRICSKQHIWCLRCFHLIFSPCFLLMSLWCNYSLEPTGSQLGRREIRFPYDWHSFNGSPCLPKAYNDINFSRWDIAAEVYELVC